LGHGLSAAALAEVDFADFSKSNTGQMVSALRIQAPGGFKNVKNGPETL
jgi:hypothetical protein